MLIHLIVVTLTSANSDLIKDIFCICPEESDLLSTTVSKILFVHF